MGSNGFRVIPRVSKGSGGVQEGHRGSEGVHWVPNGSKMSDWIFVLPIGGANFQFEDVFGVFGA